jgi:hypothetical protein
MDGGIARKSATGRCGYRARTILLMQASAAATLCWRLNFHFWVGCVALVAIVSGSITRASADAAEPDRPWMSSVTPVYQMSRPLYAPAEIKIGNFLAAPTASQTVTYNDNIFASDTHKFADAISTTTEGLNIESPWKRDSVKVHAYLSQQYYASHSTEDANSYGVDSSASFDLGNNGAVNLGAGFLQQPQARNSAQADSLSVGRPIYNTLSGEAGYAQDWGRFGNLVKIEAVQTAYITAADAARSGVKQSYQDRLNYALTGDSWVFLEGTYSPENWLLNGSLRNFDILSALAGVGTQVAGLVDAEIGVGVLSQKFRFSGFPDLTTPIFGGHIAWNILPLTTVLVSANKTVTGLESFCGVASGFGSCVAMPGGSNSNSANQLGSVELQTAEIDFQHEFWHNLFGGVRFRYDKEKFNPAGLIDQDYAAIFETRFLVNRNWELDLTYALNIRSANEDILIYNSGPYRANAVSLTLQAAL